jgi:hypothetical protein
MKEFTNGLPMLVVETFPFLAQFCKPKLYNGGQHWFEQFQSIKWLVGGVSQAPLYMILFVVRRKCWNGQKCHQPLEIELAQYYSRL